MQEPEGREGTPRGTSSESTRQGADELRDEAAGTGLHGSAPGPPRTDYSLQFGVFMGLLSMRPSGPLILCLLLSSFPPLDLPCPTWI